MEKYQYSADWIHKLESKKHWLHYWHQLNILLSNLSESDRILEVGVGTSLTSNYLKSNLMIEQLKKINSLVYYQVSKV